MFLPRYLLRKLAKEFECKLSYIYFPIANVKDCEAVNFLTSRKFGERDKRT